jgi:hypothetical protein
MIFVRKERKKVRKKERKKERKKNSCKKLRSIPLGVEADTH